MRSPLLRRVAGLAIALFGIYWMSGAISQISRGIGSKRWPHTEAKLIEADVVTGQRRSWPRVSYDYVVHQVQLTGEVIAFGDEWPSASSQVENIRKENPLLAYYDPDDPSRAILHPGVTFGAMYRLFVSIGAIVAGVVNLFRTPR